MQYKQAVELVCAAAKAQSSRVTFKQSREIRDGIQVLKAAGEPIQAVLSETKKNGTKLPVTSAARNSKPRIDRIAPSVMSIRGGGRDNFYRVKKGRQ